MDRFQPLRGAVDAEVYKKQKFGRGGGKINSDFDFLGKINSIFPLNKS